jgi:hypothetical protein
MRKLIFILFLVACEEVTPYDDTNNSVFYTSGAPYTISIKGVHGQKELYSEGFTPTCTSQSFNKGFVTMRLDTGSYSLVINNVIKTIKIREGCNSFDVSKYRQW